LRPAQGRSNFQQFMRVLRWFGPGRQHVIVTRLFAFRAHSPYCEPNQWMEPIHCKGRVAQRLGERIQTPDMRQFVAQDGIAPQRRPFGVVGRQNYFWAPGTGRQWDLCILAFQQRYGAPDTQEMSYLPYLRSPGSVVNGNSLADEESET
jgi:hypothetical protein